MSFRTSHATLSTLLYDAVCMCSGFYVPQMQLGRSRAGGLVDSSLPRLEIIQPHAFDPKKKRYVMYIMYHTI